jgi:hypothetical protein
MSAYYAEPVDPATNHVKWRRPVSATYRRRVTRLFVVCQGSEANARKWIYSTFVRGSVKVIARFATPNTDVESMIADAVVDWKESLHDDTKKVIVILSVVPGPFVKTMVVDQINISLPSLEATALSREIRDLLVQ